MKKALPLFWKSFLISFVILFSLGALLFWGLMSSRVQAEQNASSSQESLYEPAKDEDMTVLMILCKTRADQADRFFLIRISAREDHVAIADIPVNTKVTVNARTDTLAGIYDYGGSNMAVKAVQNLFFTPVDRYLRMDDSAIAQIVDALGGMEYEVLRPVSYQNASGQTVAVETGRQLLDGRRMAALLREPGEDASPLIAALIEQRMTEAFAGRVDDFYKQVVDIADTNISSFDFEYRRRGIVQMLTLQSAQVHTVSVYGQEEEEMLVISEECRKGIQERFGTIQK